MKRKLPVLISIKQIKENIDTRKMLLSALRYHSCNQTENSILSLSVVTKINVFVLFLS